MSHVRPIGIYDEATDAADDESRHCPECQRCVDAERLKISLLESELDRLRAENDSLSSQVRAVLSLIKRNGCECDCGHSRDEIDRHMACLVECELCLACNIRITLDNISPTP